jgi:hypothetical protein
MMEVAGPLIETFADELRSETRQLLQTVNGVEPAISRLALSSAPFGVRSELIAYGLGEDDPSGSFQLTALGEAILLSLPPLSAEEKLTVAAHADQALAAHVA